MSGKLLRSRGAISPEVWERCPRLKKGEGDGAPNGATSPSVHAAFTAWRLSARRLGDFCPRGRASGQHDRGAFWVAPSGRLPAALRLPPSSSPFGQPHVVGADGWPGPRVRGLRGRTRGPRPEPHERCNRFASPPGQRDVEYSPSQKRNQVSILCVMAWLVPAIHGFLVEHRQGVDARHNAGHHEEGC